MDKSTALARKDGAPFDFASITEVQLATGSHNTPEEGLCFMEMVAWFAGEKHSDKPACACPVLGAYGIGLNDGMRDAERDRLLKPLVPLIAGTRGTWRDEVERARFLALWTVNKVMPVLLRAFQIPEFDALASQCEAARSDDELRASALASALASASALVAELLVEGLRQAIQIGPHEGFDLAVDLAARRAKLRELVAA